MFKETTQFKVTPFHGTKKSGFLNNCFLHHVPYCGKSIRAMSLQRHHASDIRIIPAKSNQIDDLSAETAIFKCLQFVQSANTLCKYLNIIFLVVRLSCRRQEIGGTTSKS